MRLPDRSLASYLNATDGNGGVREGAYKKRKERVTSMKKEKATPKGEEAFHESAGSADERPSRDISEIIESPKRI